MSSLFHKTQPFRSFFYTVSTYNSVLVAAGLENLLRFSLIQVVEYPELQLGPIFWKDLVLCKLLILKGTFIVFINYAHRGRYVDQYHLSLFVYLLPSYTLYEFHFYVACV